MYLFNTNTFCNRVFISTLLVVFPVILLGQKPEKAFKYLYKKEYLKASQIFRNDLLDNEYDALSNYGLALIYSDSTSSFQNLPQAYRFIRIASESVSKMPEKQLQEALKIVPEFVNKISSRKAEIEYSLFLQIQSKRSIDDLVSFEQDYSDSKYYEQVKQIRSKLEFDKAAEINTIKGYNEFIERFPNSNEVYDAIKLRNSLAFFEVKQANILYKYNEFLDHYSNDTSLVNQVIKLRNKCAFNIYKDYNTIRDIDELNYFIERFPSSEQKDLDFIIQLKGNLEFQKAINSQNVIEIQDFINRHYGFPQIVPAVSIRDSIVFAEISLIASEPEGILANFLATYPFARQLFDNYLKQYRKDLVPSKLIDEKTRFAYELAICKGTKQAYRDFLKISTDYNLNRRIEEKLKEFD